MAKSMHKKKPKLSARHNGEIAGQSKKLMLLLIIVLILAFLCAIGAITIFVSSFQLAPV